MSKKLLLPAILAAVLAIAVAGAVFAQTATPTPNTPQAGRGFRFGGPLGGFGLGMQGRGNWTEFDAIASALKMTPTDLFNELHSGKSLSAIAQEKGVAMSALQTAAQNARTQAMKDAINQAVKAGTITQDEANWLLQGLQNGWLGRAFGGFGRFGGGFNMGPQSFPRGGMRMPHGRQQVAPKPTPNA
jgi:hypothetical protein